MNLRELQRMLTEGENPYISISDKNAVLLHYIEEVGELVKASRQHYMDRIAEEIGDNMILLCFTASALGVDLEVATINKIKKNIREGKFNLKYHTGLRESDLFKLSPNKSDNKE